MIISYELSRYNIHSRNNICCCIITFDTSIKKVAKLKYSNLLLTWVKHVKLCNLRYVMKIEEN